MAHPSKFFSLLRTLTEDELAGFQKYLHRCHGGETTNLKVFSYCKEFHPPETDLDKIDLASAYRKLFKAEMGTQENARKKMLNPLSDLNKWLREYLLAEKMDGDNWMAKMVWMSIMQERGLHQDFSKLAVQVYKEQLEIPLSDAAACLQQIASGMYFKRHLVQHNSNPDYQALIECSESIRQSADIISLKMTCEILNDQKIRGVESIELSATQVPPLKQLYQMIATLLSTGVEDDFPVIVDFMDQHLDSLGANEVVICTQLLHNFAAPKVRSSKVISWGKQIHALDKILLKKGLFTQKGVMSPITFCNIVNVACSAQEVAWARDFMRENEHLLPEEARTESLKLSHAIIAFEEKDFRKALELVENPQLKLIQHMARAKALKLRALYELDIHDDRIEDLCFSFEIYLKRNRQEKPDFVDATLSFLHLFKKLYLRKVSKEALIREIEAAPKLYFQPWLLEKAAKYKGGNT